MKKLIKMFLVLPIVAIAFFIASCSDAKSAGTPRFDGMSLSNTSPLTNLGNEVLTVPQSFSELDGEKDGETPSTTTDENEEEEPSVPVENNVDEEYEENHKLGDEIDVPENDMPSNATNDFDPKDIVIPTISVTPHEQQTQFYAEVNSDVFISVSLVNPNSYAILRFTLNGVVYQSYQFESGSTSTLLVLKVNSGSESGIKEFTIDEIKYVEDGTNEIKDAIIEGGNTVKLSVGYEVSPAVSLINEGFDLTSYEATLGVTDPNNLIDFNNDNCTLYLTDGVSIIDTKKLSVGTNNIKFENLVLGQEYKYVVTANYDRLDEAGFSLHVLYEGNFNLSAYCRISNVATKEDAISFDYRLLNKAATITNIILFDKNGYAVDEWLAGDKEFKNLNSNSQYTIRLFYSVVINGETKVFYDEFKASTRAYDIPTISATYSIKEAGIELHHMLMMIME